MTRYLAWDPTNESREDAEAFDVDDMDHAAQCCAERDYNNGDSFTAITIHVCEFIDGSPVFAVDVIVEYDPMFTATKTVEVKP